MHGSRILFVDDDPNILAGYQRTLRKRYSVATALSADEGLALIESDGPFAVVVADMQMPGTNGIQFLRKAQEKAPDSIRLMLTGNADQKTAIDAVNEGHVFTFLTKPCPSENLEMALERALNQHRLVMAEKELLENTLNGAIKVLTDVLAMVDAKTFGLAERLREEVRAIARGFNASRAWELELGAMLSQIGYVSIPPIVIEKIRAGLSLTPVERDMIARIPESGASLISNIPRLHPVADIVRYQTKNFDGTGIPNDKISGEEIPIGARILRVLIDLLKAESAKKSRLDAFTEMRQKTGQYDPGVLQAVAARFDIFLGQGTETAEPKQIAFSDLQVGHVLAGNLKTKEGTLLMTAGNKISPILLQKLRNFAELSGIQEPISIQPN
jgi:response regulator RpfG family c-di-GMP phosphodiesterase